MLTTRTPVWTTSSSHVPFPPTPLQHPPARSPSGRFLSLHKTAGAPSNPFLQRTKDPSPVTDPGAEMTHCKFPVLCIKLDFLGPDPTLHHGHVENDESNMAIISTLFFLVLFKLCSSFWNLLKTNVDTFYVEEEGELGEDAHVEVTRGVVVAEWFEGEMVTVRIVIPGDSMELQWNIMTVTC